MDAMGKRGASLLLAPKVEVEVEFKKVRSATLLYTASLLLVAILTIVGQSLIHNVLSEHRTDGNKINIAGRQRMLSQRVTLKTISYALAVENGDEDSASLFLEQAKAAKNLFVNSNDALINGNDSPQFGLDKEKNSTILGHFDELDLLFTSLITLIDTILDNSNGTTTTGLNSAMLKDLNVYSHNYLVKMNFIVFEYSYIANDKVHRLEITEIALLTVTLFVMVSEIWFVVVPAIKHMRKIEKLHQQKEASQLNLPSRNVSVKRAESVNRGESINRKMGVIGEQPEIKETGQIDPSQNV